MGRLIVTEFSTLDGVAQAPGAPDEDQDGRFPFGGWQAPYVDEEAGQNVFEQAKTMDALLLGRKTYDIFAGYWPTASPESPFTGLLNGVPKLVASRSLTEPLSWNNSSLLPDDLAAGIQEAKQTYNAVHVIGSLDLLQSLLHLGLVDQLNLWIHPLVLGKGKRVFSEGTVPSSLGLVESVTHTSGVLQLVYEPAGEPVFGTVGATD